MDANEIFARQQFAQALARTGSGVAGDDAAAAVIREAQANNAREKARLLMEQDELFTLFNTNTTNDEVFNRLQALGFIAMGVQMIPGSRWRGTQDRGELVFERRAWDRFAENLVFVAERMGFTRKK